MIILIHTGLAGISSLMLIEAIQYCQWPLEMTTVQSYMMFLDRDCGSSRFFAVVFRDGLHILYLSVDMGLTSAQVSYIT